MSISKVAYMPSLFFFILDSFCILSCDASKNINSSDSTLNGIYVYSYHAKDPTSSKLIKLLPDDSIFYYNGYAIEKIIGSHDVIIEYGLTREERFKEFNFIDFSKQRFFKAQSSSEFSSINNPNWTDLHTKSLGIQIYYPYYKDEKYESKDTVIENKSFRLVRFVSSQQNESKGALLTFLLKPDLVEGPIFNVGIENAFKGKIETIKSVFPNNQGEVIISINFIEKPSDYYMLTLIKDFITRLKI